MCPLEIYSLFGNPIDVIYHDERGKIIRKETYMAPFIPNGKCTVRPSKTVYDVEVMSFSDSPGGMLSSDRISKGPDIEELILSTPEDLELPDSGLYGAIIDGVVYIAVNPGEKSLTGIKKM